MSVILVVEQDAGRAERVSAALRRDGLSVTTVAGRAEALGSAEERMPGLLLASSAVPDLAALVADFSRRRGGPGAIVMAEKPGLAEDHGADEILAEPFSDDQLRELVQRCLTSGRPDESTQDSSEAEQLTSADIFGDVLAEVEAEARSTKPATEARKPSLPMADIERRLEETLSGVIPLAGKGKRPATARGPGSPGRVRRRRPEAQTEAEIDDLLDQTLSSLDIPARPRKSPAPTAPPADVPSAPVREDARTAAAVPPPAAAVPPPAAAAPTSEPTTDTFGRGEIPEMPVRWPPASLPSDASRPFDHDGAPAPVESTPAEPTPAEPTPTASADVELFGQSFTPSVSMLGATAPEESTGATPLTSLDELQPEANQFRTQALPTFDLAAEVSEGEAFGDYTLLDRIATGGMAEVWRARRRGVEGFQKTVAIKKILSHLTGSQDFITMFIDEAKLAAQLSHNNIIQIYDLGKVGDDFFIAMEHVDGKDLRSILTASQESSRPIPLGLGLLIVSAVARALEYAHRKRDFDGDAMGLVHRDVSPQNVMISYEGTIKLCDFGIVKAVAKASTTQMGALKGKLQYMSPEQAWGKSVDARSDIFSLGSVFYEVLTGSQLFSGESEISVLDAVRECRISSPREIVPEIPEEVAAIVGKALAKSPDERFQTAGDLEHEIRAVLDNLRTTPRQKDLARYLHGLFDLPKSGAVALATPGATDGAAPDPLSPAGLEAPALVAPSVAPAVAAPTIGAPSVAEPPIADSAEQAAAEKPAAATSSGTWKWLAAAALAAILAAIGFLVLPSLLQREESPSATAPPPRVEAAPAAPVVSPAPLEDATEASIDDPTSETGLTDPDAATGDAATGDTETAEATADPTLVATEAPPAEPGAVTAAGIDIEQMVNDELTSRAEQLRKDFEAEKKRIERELARTQAEDKPPAEDGKDDGGGDE